MRMKNRWIGGLALATALMLGACAPPNQGAADAAEPADAVEQQREAWENADDAVVPDPERPVPFDEDEPTP